MIGIDFVGLVSTYSLDNAVHKWQTKPLKNKTKDQRP